jgi:hypothetical protein
MTALEAEIAGRADRLKEVGSELLLAPADMTEARQRVGSVLDAIETLSKTEARAHFREHIERVRILRFDTEKPYPNAKWQGGIDVVWHGSFTLADLDAEGEAHDPTTPTR